MAIAKKINISRGAVSESVSIAKTEVISGSARNGFDEDIPAGSTDLEVIIAINVNAVKGFILVSDQVVTVETNDGSAPDDTIVLVADKPYIFATGDYNAFLLGTDVTSLFITNASGETANVQCEFVYDAVPSSPSASPSASASSSPSASPSTSPSTSASSSPSSSPSAT